MRFSWQQAVYGNYGHKRGLLRFLVGRAYLVAGGYRTDLTIDWNIVQRLVFICKGNICRSAYAEARARQLGLTATSAGWEAEPGRPAHSDAIRLGERRNIDLTDHRASQVAQMSFRRGDLLLCMEPSHVSAIRRLTGQTGQQQVTLLGLWATDRRPFLQDPYGLSDEYWNTCLDLMDSALCNISSIMENRA